MDIEDGGALEDDEEEDEDHDDEGEEDEDEDEALANAFNATLPSSSPFLLAFSLDSSAPDAEEPNEDVLSDDVCNADDDKLLAALLAADELPDDDVGHVSWVTDAEEDDNTVLPTVSIPFAASSSFCCSDEPPDVFTSDKVRPSSLRPPSVMKASKPARSRAAFVSFFPESLDDAPPESDDVVHPSLSLASLSLSSYLPVAALRTAFSIAAALMFSCRKGVVARGRPLGEAATWAAARRRARYARHVLLLSSPRHQSPYNT